MSLIVLWKKIQKSDIGLLKYPEGFCFYPIHIFCVLWMFVIAFKGFLV